MSFRLFCTQTKQTHTCRANESMQDLVYHIVSYVMNNMVLVVTTSNICESKPALVFIVSSNERFNANKQTERMSKQTLLIKICSINLFRLTLVIKFAFPCANLNGSQQQMMCNVIT